MVDVCMYFDFRNKYLTSIGMTETKFGKFGDNRSIRRNI